MYVYINIESIILKKIKKNQLKLIKNMDYYTIITYFFNYDFIYLGKLSEFFEYLAKNNIKIIIYGKYTFNAINYIFSIIEINKYVHEIVHSKNICEYLSDLQTNEDILLLSNDYFIIIKNFIIKNFIIYILIIY